MTETVVITGANRGIGLALTGMYQQRGARVIAICRRSSPELEALNTFDNQFNNEPITILSGIGLTNAKNLAEVNAALANTTIDILINNAGILLSDDIDNAPIKGMREQFEVNALAPLQLSLALKSKMNTRGKIVFITSRMGSIADNTSGGSFGYRMSKVALNAAAKSLAIDLTPDEIFIGLIHPGFVKTELVGFDGDITTLESAKNIIARIEALTFSDTGTFYHANGSVLPW